MLKKRKVLVIASNSSMNSGASHSLVTFVRIINQVYQDVHIDVLLPENGDIENELKAANIHYRIIRYSNALWKKPIGQAQIGMIGIIIRKCINFIAEIRLKKIVKRYDLVHINAVTTNMGVKAAYSERIKVIWHIREFLEEDLGLEFYNRKYALKMLNRADMRLAISQSVKNKYNLVLDTPINIVYNGINIRQFYNEHLHLFKKPKINILMLGRICPQKGQHILLEALANLKKKNINCFQTRFFGEVQNEYYEKLDYIIKENGLDVEISGRTNNIQQEYDWADITCVCSIKEAFGRVTIEGMLAKTLVIGADSGGTAELIIPYQTGLLFQNENANSLSDQLQYCINHLEEMKIIAAKGQKYAETNFSAELNAEKIYNSYMKLIDKPEG